MKKIQPKWTPDAPVADNVRRELPLMMKRFLLEGDRAARSNTPVEKLHQFRLSAKALRYTLEAFRRIYGPALSNYVECVRSVQTALGELNDCHATRAVLAGLAGDPATPTLLAYLEKREFEKRDAFQRLWTSRFSDKAFRASFVQYTRSYARHTSP